MADENRGNHCEMYKNNAKNSDRLRSNRLEATVRKFYYKCLFHGTDNTCLD